MAGKASWEYRGDPERPALLVQFSNGTVQTPENVVFNLYKNKASSKAKRQRILTAQTERLSYVGKNFTPEALKSSSLCRYFVGALNKQTGKMEVYDAERFSMQPILEKNATRLSDEQVQDTPDQPSRTYREKVDALIEAFGTNKQKRALTSRKLNQVGSEILSKEMTKAAEEIIESKGTELVQEVVERKEEESYSLFLPPCNAHADKKESVYEFDQLISPVEYESLKNVSAVFKNMTPEELQERIKKKQHGAYVLQELGELKYAQDIDRKARVLWYLDTLTKLINNKIIKRKDLVALECPNVMIGNFLKNFTVTIFKNESVKNSISATMKCKIASYVLALALHISDFQVDLTLLQRDLKFTENRMLEISKAMGLRINKRMMFSSLSVDEGHKIGSLELPLPVYKPGAGRKRKAL
ncbi:DNA-directed RNA polymerase I subunit RPA49 [Dendrobates tinctorius]|uniref:DNA-directed RNA polymerase I subunit RPA49 n=1 Tax=Dendrobates tinctorius TaxID=92724 RepID=UPI003CC9FB60